MAAVVTSFQPLPRYCFHPQWPAHFAVLDPFAMAAGQLQHPGEAVSSLRPRVVPQFYSFRCSSQFRAVGWPL